MVFNIEVNGQSVFKTEPLKNSISFGISAPLGTHKEDFDAAYSPNLQLNFTKLITSKLSANTSLGIFGNGVRRTIPYFKYEVYSVAIPLTLQYEFYKNFNLEAGYQQQVSIFERYAVLNGTRKTGKAINVNPLSKVNTGYILGGIKFRLNDLLSLTVRYGYAIPKTTSFNLYLDTLATYGGSFTNNQIQLLVTYNLPDMAKPKSEKEIGIMLIKNLKSGALLVVFPHTDSIIQNDAALNAYYKNLISEAKKQYVFSKIYFFGYEHLNQVSNHTYVNYLDDNAKVTSQILPSELNVLIATIGMKEETGMYKITDLVIRDSENLKISNPFPYLFENNSVELKSKEGYFIFTKVESSLQKFYSKNVK